MNIKEELKNNIDKCAFRAIFPRLFPPLPEYAQQQKMMPLPPDERHILVLAVREDLTVEEVGAVCVNGDKEAQIDKWLDQEKVKYVSRDMTGYNDEMKRYSLDFHDIASNQAIECLSVPPIYVIKILDYLWV